jgi:hypothetical protein
MRPIQISLGILLLSCFSGCYEIEDNVNDLMISSKIQCSANYSWIQNRSLYCDIDCLRHFGDGYKSGYAGVAGGGSSCQPLLPPRKYWSACYQNAEGQCKIQSWFDGYSHGALAAEQDNAALYNRIQTSSTGKVWESESDATWGSAYDEQNGAMPPAPAVAE